MTSLYDYMLANGFDGGVDVYDNTVDTGCCMSIEEDEEDAWGVCMNFILKNVDLVQHQRPAGYVSDCLIGDFWSFGEQNYEKFEEFCKDCNNDRYQMDDEDRDENLCVVVDTIIGLINGNYGNNGYKRFLSLFDLIPEDHVVYDCRIMDIDDYLAALEREDAEFQRSQEDLREEEELREERKFRRDLD